MELVADGMDLHICRQKKEKDKQNIMPECK